MKMLMENGYRILIAQNYSQMVDLANLAYEENLFVDDPEFYLKDRLEEIIEYEESDYLLFAKMAILQKRLNKNEYKTIGVCLLTPMNIATISIFVSEEERNKGVGTILIKVIKEENEIQDLSLLTFGDGLKDSEYFFKSMIRKNVLSQKLYINEKSIEKIERLLKDKMMCHVEKLQKEGVI